MYHNRVWSEEIDIPDTGGENSGTQPAAYVTFTQEDIGRHTENDDFCMRHTEGDYTGKCGHRMAGFRSPTCPQHSEQDSDGAGGAIKRAINSRPQEDISPIHTSEQLTSYCNTYLSQPLINSTPSLYLNGTTTRRVFMSMRPVDVDKDKSLIKSREVRYDPTLKIKRVRQVVSTNEPFKALVRNFPCLCISCMQRKFDECELKSYVPPMRDIWFTPETRDVSFTRSRDIVAEPEETEPEDDISQEFIILSGTNIAVATDENDSGFYLVQAISDTDGGLFWGKYFNRREKDNIWILTDRRYEFHLKSVFAIVDTFEKKKMKGRGEKFVLDSIEYDEISDMAANI